jgi:hypothetical protein
MKVVFTVSSPSHIAQAKTLMESALQHNPGYTAFIGLFNSDSFCIQHLEEFGLARIIDIDKIGIESYEKMKKQYTQFELSTALKPQLAYHILTTYEVEHVIYLDSDILVYDKFLEQELPDKDIFITSHSNSAIVWDDNVADKARSVLERAILRGGVYNSGYFYLKNTPVAIAFAKWWKGVLVDGAYSNVAIGLFTDQLWVNFAPVYFGDDVYVVRNPGYNFAYWNLDERMLEEVNNKYVVKSANGNSGPLVFSHFSGYRLTENSKITVYECLYDFESRPLLVGLFNHYREAVLRNGYLLFSEKYKFKVSIQTRIKKKVKRIAKKLIGALLPQPSMG